MPFRLVQLCKDHVGSRACNTETLRTMFEMQRCRDAATQRCLGALVHDVKCPDSTREACRPGMEQGEAGGQADRTAAGQPRLEGHACLPVLPGRIHPMSCFAGTEPFDFVRLSFGLWS